MDHRVVIETLNREFPEFDNMGHLPGQGVVVDVIDPDGSEVLVDVLLGVNIQLFPVCMDIGNQERYCRSVMGVDKVVNK